MKKVLLLSPPYRKDYMRNARCDFVSLSGTQWFPILLGYLGAFLENKGCSIKLIDAPAYNLSFKQVETIYLDYKPDFLVVYPGDKSKDSDIEFTDFLLTKYDAPAIFVGPYFSMDSSYFLKKSERVFQGVEGEFEHAVWKWIEGQSLREIKKLLFKRDGDIVKNDSGHNLSQLELDNIPFVSDFFYRHLNFKYYQTPSEPHPFVDIMTGRGCDWGLCTFCLWVHTYVKGKSYNKRSIENVINELEFVEKNMKFVRSVMIQDDTFPQERIIEFCNEKLKRNIKIRWSCYVRADLDSKTLGFMKKAGCLNLHVGFETVNNEILKKIRKGLTKERMDRFALDSKKAGLKIHGDFLIGLPGDSEDNIRNLINWACAIRPYTAQFQIFIPFQGTYIYQELKQQGFLKNNRINYPYLSNEKIEYLSKLAYRKFYFSFPYALEVLKNPINLFCKKTKVIKNALASLLWRKLDIR